MELNNWAPYGRAVKLSNIESADMDREKDFMTADAIFNHLRGFGKSEKYLMPSLICAAVCAGCSTAEKAVAA